MKAVMLSMLGVLAAVALGAPVAAHAEPSLSPEVLACQKNRSDPAPCWSDFLAGPGPVRHKTLLVALSFSTSYRPAPTPEAAAFLARLLQASEQETAGPETAREDACASPDCRTEDAFYAHAVRDAWAVVQPAADDAHAAAATTLDRLGAEPE